MRLQVIALLMMLSGAAFGANERTLKVQLSDVSADLADDPVTTIEPGNYPKACQRQIPEPAAGCATLTSFTRNPTHLFPD